MTGAADIPVDLIRRVHTELPFSFIVTGYGLTEAGTASATGPTTTPRPSPRRWVDRVPASRSASSARAAATLPSGEAGEVLLRGGSVMAGYLDDPGETAKVLSPDGWLRTGDLGVIDDAGRLRIVGRVKDMFIVGGFNAYPAEIENALLRHPAVQQAAVIGIPDERLGEVGMAFVVVSQDVTAADIIEWSRGEMANYKVPRAVEIVDELPLNATGKVMKDTLRERAAAVQARALTPDDRWPLLPGRPARRGAGRVGRRAGGRRPVGRLGRRRHQGGAADRRPHAERVRLARASARTFRTPPSARTTAVSAASCSTSASPKPGTGWSSCLRRPTCS